MAISIMRPKQWMLLTCAQAKHSIEARTPRGCLSDATGEISPIGTPSAVLRRSSPPRSAPRFGEHFLFFRSKFVHSSLVRGIPDESARWSAVERIVKLIRLGEINARVCEHVDRVLMRVPSHSLELVKDFVTCNPGVSHRDDRHFSCGLASLLVLLGLLNE